MKKSSSNLTSLVVAGAIVLILINAVQAQEAALEPKITFDDHAKAVLQQPVFSVNTAVNLTILNN